MSVDLATYASQPMSIARLRELTAAVLSRRLYFNKIPRLIFKNLPSGQIAEEGRSIGSKEDLYLLEIEGMGVYSSFELIVRPGIDPMLFPSEVLGKIRLVAGLRGLTPVSKTVSAALIAAVALNEEPEGSIEDDAGEWTRITSLSASEFLALIQNYDFTSKAREELGR